MKRIKPKSKAARLKEIRSNMHYFQMYGRIFRRWVRGYEEKVRELAIRAREIQKEE